MKVLTGIRRRLTLTHDGKRFLDRWGLAHDRIGGFYIHHIEGPDPGLDLHDHPWSFITIVLRGGYVHNYAPVRDDGTLDFVRLAAVGTGINHRVARMPLDIAHRIVLVRPGGAWTLVLRGPTRRVWGFYPPTGRVPWDVYDYATRRPSRAHGNSIAAAPAAE